MYPVLPGFVMAVLRSPSAAEPPLQVSSFLGDLMTSVIQATPGSPAVESLMMEGLPREATPGIGAAGGRFCYRVSRTRANLSVDWY